MIHNEILSVMHDHDRNFLTEQIYYIRFLFRFLTFPWFLSQRHLWPWQRRSRTEWGLRRTRTRNQVSKLTLIPRPSGIRAAVVAEEAFESRKIRLLALLIFLRLEILFFSRFYWKGLEINSFWHLSSRCCLGWNLRWVNLSRLYY